MAESTIAMDKYEEGWGVKVNATDGDIRYTRIGNIVLLSISDLSVNSNETNLVLATGVPPATSTHGTVFVVSGFGDNSTCWRMNIDELGRIRNHYPGAASLRQGTGTVWYLTN